MAPNPLTPVTDYQSMLNRIFWFTSASALVAVWLLRQNIHGLDLFLKKIDFTVAFGNDKILPMPAGYLLPALAVGMLTRIYRLHAHISDWLGLREHFDVEVIIAEFAKELGIDLTYVPDEKLRNYRPVLSLRRRSSSSNRPATHPASPRRLVLVLDRPRSHAYLHSRGPRPRHRRCLRSRFRNPRRNHPLRSQRPSDDPQQLPPLRSRPSPRHPRRPHPRRRRPRRPHRNHRQQIRRPPSRLAA
jgi:hypothetical protein